jgi:hypothetical protein
MDASGKCSAAATISTVMKTLTQLLWFQKSLSCDDGLFGGIDGGDTDGGGSDGGEIDGGEDDDDGNKGKGKGKRRKHNN